MTEGFLLETARNGHMSSIDTVAESVFSEEDVAVLTRFQNEIRRWTGNVHIVVGSGIAVVSYITDKPEHYFIAAFGVLSGIALRVIASQAKEQTTDWFYSNRMWKDMQR